jgi:hypothetical protein
VFSVGVGGVFSPGLTLPGVASAGTVSDSAKVRKNPDPCKFTGLKIEAINNV